MASSRKLRLLFRAIVLAFGAIALFTRFHAASLLGAYDDDAFYYFQIARNIVTLHRSTFDTLHLTNGYHPLWMLVIVALTFLASGKLFFVLLQLVAFASFATTYYAARRVFLYVSTNAALPEIAAAIVALQTLFLIHGGMEITLTLPLSLLLAAFRLRPAFHWTPRTALTYGLLASLVVLSRLDAILFIGPILALDALFTRSTARLLAPITAAVPVILYALLNHHFFGTLTPVSAQAKDLRLHPGFSFTALHSSLYFLTSAYGYLIIFPAVLVVLLSLATSRKPRTNPANRTAQILGLTFIAFPILQLLTVSITSDWQIWSWYLYSFTLALAGAFLLLFDKFPSPTLPKDLDNLLAGATAVMAILYALSTTANVTPHWTTFATDVAAFAATHPGTYAMGDCAGTTGYLIHQPVVQLEGLVMDKPFLDNLRQQRDLSAVLRDYNIRYYVTFRAIPEGSCFRVDEPAKSGPDSPRMRTTLCQQPAASFPVGPTTLQIFDLAPHPAP
ncbi:MAG: hypothetical protein V4555_11625 [Acidobacteriota bacterium]